MYQYGIDALHLSESEAYRRITAARLSRSYPVILEMLEDGRIHLAGISVLSKHLTDANYEDVLARAAHKTKGDIEILVAALAPKPDVAPTIRKRPQRKAKFESPKVTTQLFPGRVGQATSTPPPAPPVSPEKPTTLKPLAPARYKVEFTASEELRDKLKRLEALMPGHNLAEVMEAAVTKKLERLEAKRYAKTNKPRKSVEDADTLSGVRGIAAPVKRRVWERDGVDAHSSAPKASAARSTTTGWSSTTMSPTPSAGTEAQPISVFCIAYADIGISDILAGAARTSQRPHRLLLHVFRPER